jgi:hypothetical protein
MPIIAFFYEKVCRESIALGRRTVSISLSESTDFGPSIASASVAPALSV